MPRKAKAAARTTSRPSKKKGQARPPWLFTPRRLCITAGVAVLVISLPLIGSWLPPLTDRPEYRLGPDRVVVTTTPEWVPEDIVTRVFARAGLTPEESLLDPTLAERVAAAFHTHPWIEEVVSVRKQFPARLRVNVKYRRPAALVAGVDGYYPVDRFGVLLPPRDFGQECVHRYPVIEHIASVPMGSLGESWGDPAVAAAARLADVLQQQHPAGSTWWKMLQLQAIVAPSRVALDQQDDQLEFVLRTAGGSQIRWGRAPDTRHPGELTVAQKLERLQEYRADYGGFDDEHGPWEIDIRPWHGIGRSRLADQDQRRF